MRKVEEALACQMESVIDWDIRLDINNRLPHVFPATCTGNIDTFPVYIERPKEEMQSATYSGKYKSCVLKVFLSFFSYHLFYDCCRYKWCAIILELRSGGPGLT